MTKMNTSEQLFSSPEQKKPSDRIGKFSLNDIIEPTQNPNQELWEVFGTNKVQQTVDILKLGARYPHPVERKTIRMEEQQKWKKISW
jgi:hypothetical protein